MKKSLAFFLCLCILFSAMSGLGALQVSAEQEISVYVNGEKLQFDVPPVLKNDRTLVPMRAIFEALGATVTWNNDTETASGIRNADKVAVSIDSTKALVNGKVKTLDQPAILLNDRTLVPLRFVSEAFGATVGWEDATQTVTIDLPGHVAEGYYIPALLLKDLGSWTTDGTYLFGSTGSADDEEGSVPGTAPATIAFNVKQNGKYKVWALARDFQSNRQGTRYYQIAVDGKLSDQKVGTHGQDGFKWQVAGEFDLTAGNHLLELHDTSGYYARCQGIFITNDMELVPMEDTSELARLYPTDDSMQALPDPAFPLWATEPMQEEQVVTLENGTFKINFIKGKGVKGDLVQNEIFTKKNGNWIKVKDKTEQFGYLMMQADKSETATPRTDGGHMNASVGGETVLQSFVSGAEEKTRIASDYFVTGNPYWFIPTDVQKISDSEVVLTFPAKDHATLSVVCSLDNLCDEPKFKLDVAFHKDGAYSFLLFSGDAIDETKFERVLAPYGYTRKNLPQKAAMISEIFMFTPMVSYVLNQTDGSTLTTGVVVDPTCTSQDVAYWESARYGYVLRDSNKNMRAQICAPMFGTPGSNFKAGDTYSFAYRVLAGTDSWFDTFKHVSEDMYNVKDIRTNYYSTLNDAIYNIDELVMDDKYGAWDDKSMGFYYMEFDNTESQCNPLMIAQRYLLTEDEDYYEERVVPTIAFLLSRRNNHFNRDLTDTNILGSHDLVETPNISGSAMYTSLYEMSQGRMPYLMFYAVRKNTMNASLAGVSAQQAFYNISGENGYKDAMLTLAEAIMQTRSGDAFLRSEGLMGGGFVLGDYNTQLSALLYAYETSGDPKYLDMAKDIAQNLCLTLSSKGYQNDFATNMYHVDPQATADAHVVWADNMPTWWWNGKIQWRRGFPYGTYGRLEGTVSQIDEATEPGWIFATAGLSTEHVHTGGHSNYITMNTFAANFLKLAEYTGEDYFKTQARNVVLGRSETYPGYYIDRYYTDYMKKTYPYEGPEYSLLYYTHTAPYQAMLEDFLITEAFTESDGKVEFPEMHFDGYAYFTANQYGHRPGKMYDTEGLWLWNDRGILTTSDVNVNFVAGKKDGVLGLSFINEANYAVNTEITLGEKVPNYNGTATLYAKDGSKSTVQVTNGKFVLNMPARDMQTVILEIDGIKKPSYATDEIHYSMDIQQTESKHNGGKGYVIQLNPDKYHAYVFLTDQNISSMTVDYEVDGKKESRTISEYPFETIVRVDNPEAAFKYTVTVMKKDGTTENRGGGTLKAIPEGAQKDDAKEALANAFTLSTDIPSDFKAQQLSVTSVGSGNNMLRVLVSTSQFPFELEENMLRFVKAQGVLTDKSGNSQKFQSEIYGNEMRDGSTVIIIKGNESIDLKDIDNKTLSEFQIYMNEPMEIKQYKLPESFEKADISTMGLGTNYVLLRVVASTPQFGFDVSENMLEGLNAQGYLTPKAGGTPVKFTGTVEANEMRANGSTVICIKVNEDIDHKQIENMNLSKFVLYRPGVVIPEVDAEEVLKNFKQIKGVTFSGLGSANGYLRVIAQNAQFPFEMSADLLKGLRAKGTLKSKDGKTVKFDGEIGGNEMRGASTVVMVNGVPDEVLNTIMEYTLSGFEIYK